MNTYVPYCTILNSQKDLDLEWVNEAKKIICEREQNYFRGVARPVRGRSSEFPPVKDWSVDWQRLRLSPGDSSVPPAFDGQYLTSFVRGQH